MTRFLVIVCFLFAFVAGGAESRAQSGGKYFLQLASVKSEERARGEWTRLQKVHADILGDMTLALQTADLGDQGIYYRIQTGPFPTQATAQDMCWQLRAEKQDCLVLRRR
jgi:cell division septation protein DedD